MMLGKNMKILWDSLSVGARKGIVAELRLPKNTFMKSWMGLENWTRVVIWWYVGITEMKKYR